MTARNPALSTGFTNRYMYFSRLSTHSICPTIKLKYYEAFYTTLSTHYFYASILKKLTMKHVKHVETD